MGADQKTVLSTPAPSTSPPLLDYDVQLVPDGERLSILAKFPAGISGQWLVESPAQPFVQAVEVSFDQGRTFHSEGLAASRGITRDTRQLCEQQGCWARYSFLLAAAATQLNSRTTAIEWDDSFVAPASSWLLRPRAVPSGAGSRFRVSTADSHTFVTGTLRSSAEPTAYEAPIPRGFFAPYSAFGRLRVRSLDIGHAKLTIAFLSNTAAENERHYLDWIDRSAQAIAKYYGQFPVSDLLVLMRASPYFGTQMGIGGTSVLLGMDHRLSRAAILSDWVAAHEMVHVAFPSVARRKRWASEGLATYVESVARCQAGQISRQQLWSLLIEKLPLGQPGETSAGLNHTRTWASTYWGGALFWFVADLKLLSATEGQIGLREVLQTLVARNFNATRAVPLTTILKEADDWLERPLLLPLYEQHAHHPTPVDLESLWNELGIRRAAEKLAFDPGAPRAEHRCHIENGRGCPQ